MIYEFNDYSFDVDRHELRHGDKLVSVEPGVLDLLHFLVRNRDRVVSKDELIANVWNGRIVSDSTLTSRVTALRHAVGDRGEEKRLIRTIARKGIRFVGEIREATSGGAPVASQLTAWPKPLPKLPDKPSITVLPFTNMSGDPEQEYFSDGISEDIITALSRLRWFFVVARNSSFAYKGQPTDVRQIGRDLGVRYLLEGSVRKSGQRIRITCQLLDATTGNHIWSERYDRELTDIFALQDEITASVTAAIEPKLMAAEGHRAETRSIDDLDAWDLVARALPHFWKFSASESELAITALRQAVQRHPNYAPAHSMLSFALLFSAYAGWTPADSEREHAAQFAYRAIELDENDPWAHLAVGFLAMTDRDTEEAVRHFNAALDLNPNFVAAIGLIGFALALDGQSKEAIACLEKAARMNPHDPFTNFFFAPMAAAYYLDGNYAEAIKWARQAVRLRPGYTGGHRILCASLAQAGQREEARLAMSALRQLQPDISIEKVRQSVPYTPRVVQRFLDGMRKAGLTV